MRPLWSARHRSQYVRAPLQLEPDPRAVVEALGRKFCESHFLCVGCDQSIASQEVVKFNEWDTKPMCKHCYGRLPTSLQKKLTKYAELELKYQKQIAKEEKKSKK